MNLDNLKELEEKVWLDGVEMFGETHEELYFRNKGDTLCRPMKPDHAGNAVELLNQTKEMIETIERYRTALEKSQEYQRLAYNQLYKSAQDEDFDTNEESKNRMLHNVRTTRGNMILGIETCMEALKDPEKNPVLKKL